MKSFIVTLVVLASLVLAYDAFVVPPSDRLIFAKPRETPTVSPDVSAPESTPAVVAESKPVAPAAVPEKPAPVPAAPPEMPPAAPVPAPVLTGFQPPKYDPIEVLTGNWQKIPKSAFGRIVKLTKPVVFKMAFGESTVPPGKAVTAVGMENGWLAVAPTANSTVRGYVGLDDCDFKTQLIEAYEKWKNERTAWLKVLFEKKLESPVVESVATASPTALADASGKPLQAADGTYPLLVAKMRTGDPSEITLKNITHWGTPDRKSVV